MTPLCIHDAPWPAEPPAIHPLGPGFVAGLVELLESLVTSGDAAHFHPHAYDRRTVAALAAPRPVDGDEYHVALDEQGRVVAYGLLRGWEEGYDVPSLGIAVHADARGRGLARALMAHLHDRARARGAARVRLKVYRDNIAAVRLYASLGYRLEPHDERQWLGVLDLARHDRPAAPRRIAVAEPDLSDLEADNALAAIRSTWISSTGPFLDRFEREFAAACDCPHALGVSNGTTALHLALAALNVGPGDEVIVPAMTYVATANAVRYCGAEPVFVDVDPDTWCLDPALIEDAITPRTKGIVAVHLLGHPADMDPITELAEMHGLWVVEDAAEAPFATYKGRRVGGLGRIAAFSFYGNKLLTAGEGGAVTFRDATLARRLRMLRGQGMDPRQRYYFPIVGYNYRLTNVAAAILCGQMDRRESLLRRRCEIVARYAARLQGVPGLELRTDAAWAGTSPWMFALLVDAAAGGVSRDDVARALAEGGVETRPLFIPIHVLPPYRGDHDRRAGGLPVTERLGRDGLMLPTHTRLGDAEVDEVCDRVVAAVSRRRAVRRAA